MADATPTRTGQVNGAGDEFAIFLKVFSGEILAAFDEYNIMEALHMIKSITHGKSAQFPASGKVTAVRHQPGQQILGQNQFRVAERIINIDLPLVAHEFIAEIDELFSHTSLERAELRHQLGQALACEFDETIFRVVVLASRAAATVSGQPGGTELIAATAASDASVLAGALFDAATAMDEKDIPENYRYSAFRPAQYYLLVQNTDLINRDFGGAGSFSDGVVTRIAGFPIMKSNHVPNEVVAAVTGERNTYDGDFSTTVGVCWHKSAAGTVRRKGFTFAADWLPDRLGHLMTARYVMGHGILRPESAVEIKSAATP